MSLQQSLVQVFVLALQHSAQFAHFSAAKALDDRAATEAAAMSVRMVFMMSLVVLCFAVCPLEVTGMRRRHARAGFATDGN